MSERNNGGKMEEKTEVEKETGETNKIDWYNEVLISRGTDFVYVQLWGYGIVVIIIIWIIVMQ